MKKINELWIVGKINPANHLEWEFGGIFDEQSKALEVCIDERFFIAPVILNEKLPDKTISFPNSYYPIEN